MTRIYKYKNFSIKRVKFINNKKDKEKKREREKREKKDLFNSYCF